VRDQTSDIGKRDYICPASVLVWYCETPACAQDLILRESGRARAWVSGAPRLRMAFLHESVDLIPIRGTGSADVRVGAVGKADRMEAPVPKSIQIVWAVFDVDVGANLVLFFHETEIPVGNSVLIEPYDGLSDCHFMEVSNEESVRDDPDSVAFFREVPQYPASTVDHRHRLEQSPLGDGESVKAGVLVWGLDSPCTKPVVHIEREAFYVSFEPFGRDFSHPGIEVGAHPIEVHAEYDSVFVCWHWSYY